MKPLGLGLSRGQMNWKKNCCSKYKLNEMENEGRERDPYDVVNGLHREPRCAMIPPGPQPTRKERPRDSPASTIDLSFPRTTESVFSTRANFRIGRIGACSAPTANDDRWVQGIKC